MYSPKRNRVMLPCFYIIIQNCTIFCHNSVKLVPKWNQNSPKWNRRPGIAQKDNFTLKLSSLSHNNTFTITHHLFTHNHTHTPLHTHNQLFYHHSTLPLISSHFSLTTFISFNPFLHYRFKIYIIHLT